MSNKNVRRLLKSIGDLQDLLRSGGMTSWADRLEEVQEGLKSRATCAKAIEQLNSYFGGMGSLNDVCFHPMNKNVPAGLTPEQANGRLELLLNRIFRDLRLLNAPFPFRILWYWLEWKHRKELPPRIKNAFR
jgi:hypothetical protein